MAELPKYVVRDGELIAYQPIEMNTTVYMFMLDSDWDSLQALCDHCLNLPGSKTVYRPLLPFAMFYASTIDNREVNDPKGWCAEVDFGFWIPCSAGHIEGSEYKIDRFLVFTPNLWVDNGIALVGGRTMFGYPKEIARFTMPAQPSDPAVFTVDTQVLPKYGPNERVVWRRLIEASKIDASPWQELKQIWSGGENILNAIEDVLNQHGPGRYPVPTIQLVMQLMRDFGKTMPNVYLKQFPDIVDGHNACYQAICEAPITITSGIKGGFLFGDFAVRIHNYESHQLVKSLGLKYDSQDGDVYTIKSLVHGWTQFSAIVEPGTIIYQPT